MQCTNPVLIKAKPAWKYPGGLLVPCGKCLQCRIKRRTEWTLRLTHELDYHEDSSFITLTYQDKYLPENCSLVKTDLQKFFKRLRKRIRPRKIKYFACGEYGEKTYRPHYHAIVYGLSLSLQDQMEVIHAWPYCDWSNDEIYKGAFGIAEQDSINYVAGYVTKKLSGPEEKLIYLDQGLEPTFKISSQGLGLDYALENKEKILNNKTITLQIGRASCRARV